MAQAATAPSETNIETQKKAQEPAPLPRSDFIIVNCRDPTTLKANTSKGAGGGFISSTFHCASGKFQWYPPAGEGEGNDHHFPYSEPFWTGSIASLTMATKSHYNTEYLNNPVVDGVVFGARRNDLVGMKVAPLFQSSDLQYFVTYKEEAGKQQVHYEKEPLY